MVALLADDPRRREKLTTRSVIIASVVLLLGAWVTTAVSIVATRQQALDHTEAEAHNFATAFADEVDQTLNNVAGSMELVAQRMRAANGAFDIYTWAHEVPLLSDATIQGAIIGPDGRLVSTTLDSAPKPIDLSDREHFRIHVDGKFKGIFISKPVTGRVSHQVTIQVTRRVNAADGRFLGVVLFSLAPSQLTSLNKTIELGRHDVILLTGLDNIIRARFTRDQSGGLTGVGQSIAGGPRPDKFPGNASGFYIRKGAVDGFERVLGYRRVGNYPLIATVGLDLDVALAPFYRYAAMLIGFTVLATFAVVGLGVYLIREIRRRTTSEIELSEAHAKLAATNHDLEVDVIRRAELEQQLREAMEHLDRVQRIAGIGSTTEDLANREYTWSPGTCAIFGINSDGVGKTVEYMRRFYHPDDRAKVIKAGEQARRRGVPAPPLEYRIIRPDGAVRVVYRENDMQCDAEGRPIRRIVTFKDITEIKTTEARLQQTQDDLNRAQRLAKVGSDARDLRTGDIVWSDELYAIFGVDPDRFMPTSENLLSLVVPEDRPKLLARRKQVSQGKCPAPIEFSVRRPDGEVRRIYSEAELVRDANGNPIRWVGMNQDITEQARIERSLRDAKAAAETANLARSQFLANVSHELRTPLNAIIGFSEMLEQGLTGPLLPKQAEYIGLVHQSGRHLLNVINDILDLARVDAEKFKLREEGDVDPSEIIDACISLTKARATDGGVQLSSEVDDELPPVIADPTRLKQILLNLISNAIKFTDPGGSVIVSASAITDGGVAFEVRDTGVGMTPDEIEIALQPFGQVDARLARSHEGTGLGLPLARRLAELHGGSLRVESKKGRGTTVTVVLPPSRVVINAAAIRKRITAS